MEEKGARGPTGLSLRDAVRSPFVQLCASPTDMEERAFIWRGYLFSLGFHL